MRVDRALGALLAAGVMLAACTKQGGDPGEAGRVVRASTQTTAPDAFAGSTPSSAKPTRFAALPDRGELLRYDAQAPIRDGAYTWHRTELSEQHALDAIATGMLRVATPNGRILGFRYDHSIRHQESGDWTWVGHLAGQEGVQAILTFGEKAVFGSIGQPDARPLRLTVQGGASWLVETDPAQLVGIASHAANPVAPDYHIIPPAALQRLRQLQRTTVGVQATALAPTTASATTAATPTVDLLIGYTQGFVTAKGSTSAVVTRLNSMVDTANEGLRNSQVNGQIRLVHTMQVNYTDTNTNDAALGQMTGYDVDNQEQTTPNAAFNALRQARDQYGADLVSLVRPFKAPEQDSCGIAWLVGGGKQGDTVTPSSGWDYFGYSVVSDGTDRNETDGKSYYCEEHTLAHELGHNMGSNHDRDNSTGSDSILDDPDDYGAFAYSFGYKPTMVGKNFYTIMAYGDSGQTSYLAFSNPRITFCGGVACGVANSEDNAQSLSQIMPEVSGFRATAATTFTDVPADFWAYSQIERLADLGITGGCSATPPLYCPDRAVLREEMAIFLLRAKYGSAYQPPAATGIFADVAKSYWAAAWIEKFYSLGITGGCSSSPLKYCPQSPILRDQMAIFLLRAKYGSSYQPPAATGMFTDVPTNYWAAAWIEQLAREGVTGGCSTTPKKFCPQATVTRDQMAVFLVRNFNL